MSFALSILAAVVVLGVLAVAWGRLRPEPAAELILGIGRAAAGLRTGVAEISGFQVSYLDGGKGEPLVLLHGIGGDKDNWAFVAPMLARHYRVIALDIPGFGESSRPSDAAYGVDPQAERLRAFLRSLGVERAHFAGNSMGGLIASHYAVRHPEEVLSLWLLSPAYVASAAPSEGFERIDRGEKNPLFARTEAELDDVLRFVMHKRPFLPHPLRRRVATRQVEHYATNLRIFDQLRAEIVPLETLVAGLAIPTLIVWGDHDRVFHPSSAAILGGVLPHSRVVVMPGIGHVPMVEAPFRVARDYLAFRRSLPPAPAAC